MVDFMSTCLIFAHMPDDSNIILGRVELDPRREGFQCFTFALDGKLMTKRTNAGMRPYQAGNVAVRIEDVNVSVAADNLMVTEHTRNR